MNRLLFKLKLKSDFLLAKDYFKSLSALQEQTGKGPLDWRDYQELVVPLAKKFNIEPKYILRDMYKTAAFLEKQDQDCPIINRLMVG